MSYLEVSGFNLTASVRSSGNQSGRGHEGGDDECSELHVGGRIFDMESRELDLGFGDFGRLGSESCVDGS